MSLPEQPSTSKSSVAAYALLFLLAAGIGILEYFHEASHDDSAVCLAPQSRSEVMGDLLFHHLKNH